MIKKNEGSPGREHPHLHSVFCPSLMAHIQMPEANMKSQIWEFVFCNPSTPTVSQEAETGHFPEA